jgi:hypothetical protein
MRRHGFFLEFLAYLRARKLLWLLPVAAVGLLMMIVAALLFAPGAAVLALYPFF